MVYGNDSNHSIFESITEFVNAIPESKPRSHWTGGRWRGAGVLLLLGNGQIVSGHLS